MQPPPASAATADPLFAQLGQLTRQLHDALTQLGLVPQLQSVADSLPDTRSRLEYVVHKTGEAADKVLTLVDAAKAERHALGSALHALEATAAEPVLLAEAQQRLQRLDGMLTEIMLAQDFHDLTGQVVRRGVTLVTELEGRLVELLLRAAPAAPAVAAPAPTAPLSGPVVDAQRRGDCVANQAEVDDLLASLGF
jgi:chemotaxis protein CheZ